MSSGWGSSSSLGAPIASPFHPRILTAELHGLCMNCQASSKPIHIAEKLEKSLIGKQRVTRITNFLVFPAFAGICKVFAGVLCAFLSQKQCYSCYSGFCRICESLRFQNPFRMKTTHKAPLCSAEQIFLNVLNGSNWKLISGCTSIAGQKNAKWLQTESNHGKM